MALPFCATFHYQAVVPDSKADYKSARWKLRDKTAPLERLATLLQTALWEDSYLLVNRLVGLRPTLTISGGRCLLTASGRHRAQIRAAELDLDPVLIECFEAGDVLTLVRTQSGDIGISLVRAGDLIYAIGAVTRVPLGETMGIRGGPEMETAYAEYDRIEQAIDAAEKAHGLKDGEHFPLGEEPEEITKLYSTLPKLGPREDTWIDVSCLGERSRIRKGEEVAIGDYRISALRCFEDGIPGRYESVAVSRIGMCPHAAAVRSARLLNAGLRGTAWRALPSSIFDEGRIAEAERSLEEMLGVDYLRGKSFLDVGSGSGLHSLAAARLGAGTIHSFDFDSRNVACTLEVKRRYLAEMENWTVEGGDVLNEDYVASLGRHDAVYSWGVLHHTGNLGRALRMVVPLVAPGGTLFIAIYHDRGWVSKVWRGVKRTYNRGRAGRLLVISLFIPTFVIKGLASDLLRGRNPAMRYRDYRKRHGMSIVYDWLDWLGGLPYEVASPDRIIQFYEQRGFALKKRKGPPDQKRARRFSRSEANNEFVFVRQS